MNRKICRLPETVSLFVVILILFHAGSLSAGNDILPITDFPSEELRDGAPLGWQLETFKGKADLRLTEGNPGYTLHMKSDPESSFGIHKKFLINPEEYSYLNWKWMVHQLPNGGDVRSRGTNDQAIQVYLIFKETGWPAKINTPVLGYIWDNEPPRDTVAQNPRLLAHNIRYLVLRNKEDHLKEWHTEKRNIVEDFKRVFPDIEGGAPREIIAVAFFINSHHTKSRAESSLADAYFSRN